MGRLGVRVALSATLLLVTPAAAEARWLSLRDADATAKRWAKREAKLSAAESWSVLNCHRKTSYRIICEANFYSLPLYTFDGDLGNLQEDISVVRRKGGRITVRSLAFSRD